MYSFRMSFCSVPAAFFQSPPCFSTVTKYMAQITFAGELMVIETLVFSSSIPEKRASISSSESIATPHLPTSPSLSAASES